MTEIHHAAAVGEALSHDDGLLRRAARAHRDAAIRLSGGQSIDDGMSYALHRTAEVLGASRAFLATWSDRAYVGRALFGAPPLEQQAFFHRPLPTLPPQSAGNGQIVQLSEVGGLRTAHPWLAELCDADDAVLAVATWAGRDPGCVVCFSGLPPLDEDLRLSIEGLLMMLFGVTIGETLVRQRNRSELRRGKALDTLVDELDRERRRISHEIHDGVLQNVSSIAHFLETLSATSESEESRAVLERLRLEAQNSAITLRRIVNDFEPEQGAEESVAVQVRALTARVTDLFGLTVDVRIGHGVEDAGLTRPILRVLRQAIDNIITHADARTVYVEIQVDPDECLTLTIDDDGKGMENDHPWQHGVGLRSMARVVNEHGGVLNFGRPRFTSGTRLTATFAIDGIVDGRRGSPSAAHEGEAPDSGDLLDAVRAATLALMDRGRRPTITSVAEATGFARRDLLNRFMSADAMIADAVASHVATIEARWDAFETIDTTDPLDARLSTMLERRFQMEEWGRPVRQHTLVVDPSTRFDAEVLAAFQPELSVMEDARRDDTGRLVAWLLRTRTIRAIISDVTVSPDVARATIHSVAGSLLRREHVSD